MLQSCCELATNISELHCFCPHTLTLQNVRIDLRKNTCLNLPWQATKLFWHSNNIVFELTALQMEDMPNVFSAAFAVKLSQVFVPLSDRAVR